MIVSYDHFLQCSCWAWLSLNSGNFLEAEGKLHKVSGRTNDPQKKNIKTQELKIGKLACVGILWGTLWPLSFPTNGSGRLMEVLWILGTENRKETNLPCELEGWTEYFCNFEDRNFATTLFSPIFDYWWDFRFPSLAMYCPQHFHAILCLFMSPQQACIPV